MGSRKPDDPEFHSERDQVAAMRKAAARGGGELELLPAEIDVSGGLPIEQRPSLLRAVEGVEAGDYCGVMVAYHSRLGREVEQEEAVWRRVEQAGGEIVMAVDGIDTTTADGRMLRRFRSAMNAREREWHGEQFEHLRETATAAGIWQRRQTPRGYRKDPQTKRLVPNRQRESVRSAFIAVASGTPISEVARRLRMTTSGVRYMIRNRVYLGELRVGKHVNPDAHPPLVSTEEFEATQAALAGPRPARREGPPALLAGLVICSRCGHRMTRSGRGSGQAVYACHRTHSGAVCPAPATVTERLLDEHVEQVAVAELQRLSVARRPGSQIERRRSDVAAGEAELAAYIDAVSVADLGAEAFQAGARTRQEAVDRARVELRNELAREPALPSIGTGAEAWELLDGHERNRLLRALLCAVVVRRAGGRGARVPLGERVRILAFGFGLTQLNGRGGASGGIVPVPLPDFDEVGVLRSPTGENRAQLASGVAEV